MRFPLHQVEALEEDLANCASALCGERLEIPVNLVWKINRYPHICSLA